MKRNEVVGFLALMFIGLFCVFGAMGGAHKESYKFSMTLTGVGSGNDSVIVDTFEVFNTEHWKNKFHIVVTLDSLPPIEGVAAGDFGDVDSVGIVVKSEYKGKYMTIDSTKTAWLNAPFTSALILDPGSLDSLYTDNIRVIIRIADTVGLVTDSSATFKGYIHFLHTYQD